MKLRHLAAILLIWASIDIGAQAPQSRVGLAGDPPGGIVLLPGYRHQRMAGADSRVGVITSSQGFTIRYDIGRMAGNRAANPKDRLWLKEQVVGGIPVQTSLNTDRILTVTFPATPSSAQGPGSPLPANFYAMVQTEEDVADLLLIALSYKPN